MTIWSNLHVNEMISIGFLARIKKSSATKGCCWSGAVSEGAAFLLLCWEGLWRPAARRSRRSDWEQMQQLWGMFGQTGLEDSGTCSVLFGSRNLSKRHLGLSSERGNRYKGDRKREPEEGRIRKEEGKSVWGAETENETKFQTGKSAGTFITLKLNPDVKTGDNSNVTAELLRRCFRCIFNVYFQ